MNKCKTVRLLNNMFLRYRARSGLTPEPLPSWLSSGCTPSPSRSRPSSASADMSPKHLECRKKKNFFVELSFVVVVVVELTFLFLFCCRCCSDIFLLLLNLGPSHSCSSLVMNLDFISQLSSKAALPLAG